MKKLGSDGLGKLWEKIFDCMKLITGNVDVKTKGNLQTQIDSLDSKVKQCFQNASDGKSLIADAITGKGVPTLVSDTFATIAANIAKIKTSPNLQSKSAVLSNVAQTVKPDAGYDGLSQVSVPAVKGTAGAGDVLAEKTFSGAAGIEKAGTMPNKGAWIGATTDNGNVAIPAGYHNGQGYVSGAGAYAKGMEAADARTNTDSANYKNGYSAGVNATKKGTAAAGDVLTGKTFTNASSVGAAGTMANKGATTVDAGAVSQDDTYTYLTVPAAGFYNANSKLRTENSNILGNVYNALVAQGVIPDNAASGTLASAIGTLATNKYNAGYNAGHNAGYGVGYNAACAVAGLSYSSVNVNVGEIWLIGLHYGANGAVGYVGTSVAGNTCSYTVIQDFGDDHGWTDRWWQKIQITGTGVLANSASIVVRIK